MNEIIAINQTIINNTEVNSVNARDLHEVLESDTKFSDWIKRRLDETDAILNADYIIVSKKRETIYEFIWYLSKRLSHPKFRQKG